MILIVIYPKLKEIGQKYDNIDSIIYLSIIAIDSSESHSIILDENGLIWKFNARTDKDYKMLISRRFLTKAISCSRYYTLIIDVDGNLWGFAYPDVSINIFGHRIKITIHLIKIELPFRVKNVVCGDEITILLDQDNNLLGCGYPEGILPERQSLFSRIYLHHKADLIAARKEKVAWTALY